MRYSNQGLWGRGIYFAGKAVYSDGYRFDNNNGTFSFFYSKVALGQEVELKSDNTLHQPPLKSNQASGSTSIVEETRYDSVKGFSNDSDIWILYENSRAYPQYLITYSLP